MTKILIIIQIVLAILVSGMILVQTGGTGFGRAFGGGSSASFTRRGLEKVLFRATFVVSALFLIVSVLSLSL